MEEEYGKLGCSALDWITLKVSSPLALALPEFSPYQKKGSPAGYLTQLVLSSSAWGRR